MRTILFVSILLAVQPVLAAEDYWVTSDRLNRRTCPSIQCGVVGKLFFREKATVIETRNGWARITKPYFASCVSGKSEYVDSGNASCTAKNGIVDGKFSEWVVMKHLSKTRPHDPGAGAKGTAKLVSGSDDYRLHKDAFITAAEKLISENKCTEKDFTESGGWIKSTTYSNKPIYFMYCGGWHKSNKIHLDVSNGRIFK